MGSGVCIGVLVKNRAMAIEACAAITPRVEDLQKEDFVCVHLRKDMPTVRELRQRLQHLADSIALLVAIQINYPKFRFVLPTLSD